MKISLPFWRTVLASGSIAAAFSAGYCLRPPTDPQQVPSTAACAPIETAVPAKPVPSTMKDAASWSQLESDDYRAFVTNLRRFGCPNSTVADIVLSNHRPLDTWTSNPATNSGATSPPPCRIGPARRARDPRRQPASA